MPGDFVGCERGQQFLMPPSLLEWLSEDYLVWAALWAGDQMELDRFNVAYRLGALSGTRRVSANVRKAWLCVLGCRRLGKMWSNGSDLRRDAAGALGQLPARRCLIR
jgi:hypothetical protein